MVVWHGVWINQVPSNWSGTFEIMYSLSVYDWTDSVNSTTFVFYSELADTSGLLADLFLYWID